MLSSDLSLAMLTAGETFKLNLRRGERQGYARGHRLPHSTVTEERRTEISLREVALQLQREKYFAGQTRKARSLLYHLVSLL